MNYKDYGQIAYESYVEAVGGVSVHGEKLPTWEMQQKHIKDAWNEAGEAVANYVRQEEGV